MTVFNTQQIDYTKQPMFLGETVNVARFDNPKYKWLKTLTERQVGFFWKPEIIGLLQDRKQFKDLTEAEKHMFISNLKYQILLDSIQGRAPVETFLGVCSLPELETWIVTWSFFETIHSRSYTYIINNVFPRPAEILDDIPIHEEIRKRATGISSYYDKLSEMVSKYKLGQPVDLYQLKKHIYLTLICVNILEGIRFYVSFACSFSFAQRSKALMTGNASIIQLIAFDEALHLSSTLHIINTLREGKDDPDYIQIDKECQDTVIELYKDAVNQEKEWANYLFSKGPVLGLNEKILKDYVEYLCDARLKAIGYKSIFGTTVNPLPWMTDWLNKGSKNQAAPQEVALVSYTMSEVNTNDDDDMDL